MSWRGNVVTFQTEDGTVEARASLMPVKDRVKVQFPDGVVEILIRQGDRVFELDDNTEWRRPDREGLSFSHSPTPFLARSTSPDEQQILENV